MGRSNVPEHAPKTVAVVEPDPAVRSSLDFSLVAEGFRVEAFASGEEFAAAAAERHYDCVVIEQRLGEAKGLDVIQQLRFSGFSAHVLLLVTHPKAPLRAKARKLAAEIIEKPLMGSLLTDRLHELLK